MKYFAFIIFLLFLLPGCDIEFVRRDETKPDYESGSIQTENHADKAYGLALFNALIIDGTGAPPIENGVILIRDNIIEAVGSRKKVTVPQRYATRDMQGYAVMPGFIDTHVHYAYDEKKLQMWLEAGVTTVRDLNPLRVGGDPIEARNRLNGSNRNARLVSASSMITSPGGYGTSFVRSAEEAVDRVNQFIDAGVDLIKFSIEDDCAGRRWNLLGMEEIQAIVSTSRLRGKRTAVHVTWSRNLQFGIDAGVHEFSHMVADRASDELLHDIAQKGIIWIPTLELWNGVSQIHNSWHIDNALENLRKFYEAGGIIALGTDYEGYVSQFDQGFPITEVRLMKKAGMSNMDIIIAATRHAAIVCDLEDSIGTLESGKIADILAVKGNPLDDIEVLLNTYMVIRNGEIIIENN